MNFTERINYILENQYFGDKKSLSKDTGIPYSTLIEYLSGKKKDPKLSLLSKLKNVNAFWLLAGKGDMILDKSAQSAQQTNVFKLKTDYSQENQEIPLFSIEAATGLVELFQSSASHIPIDTLRIPNLPKCDGALFVTGDSMYPLLKSGDIVAYKQVHDIFSGIFWGEMYLISIEVDGEEYISVKYIQKSEKGEQFIRLVSQNRHHQPKDVELSKVRAMALIKASIRINSMK